MAACEKLTVLYLSITKLLLIILVDYSCYNTVLQKLPSTGALMSQFTGKHSW